MVLFIKSRVKLEYEKYSETAELVNIQFIWLYSMSIFPKAQR